MEIRIDDFDVSNQLYQECLKIRLEVLRKPLGMIIKPEEMESDKEATHILAQVNGKAAGTVSLIGSRLRQMAVLDEFQGLGLGSKLVRHLEKVAKRNGIMEIILDARFPAIPFYEKLGYECCSDIYHKIGILHRDMKKAL